MKLKEYLEKLGSMVKEFPSSLEMEVIYSRDDEGNSYHNVINVPFILQVEDTKKYDLEVVGYMNDEGIKLEDCNAVIVN